MLALGTTERQHVSAGAVEMLGDLGQLLGRVQNAVELGVHGGSVGLVVDRVNNARTHGQLLVFTNSIGGPVGRTSFRTRVWKPAIRRAGSAGAAAVPRSAALVRDLAGV